MSVKGAVKVGGSIGEGLAKLLYGLEVYEQVTTHAYLTLRFEVFLFTTSKSFSMIYARQEYYDKIKSMRLLQEGGIIKDRCGCSPGTYHDICPCADRTKRYDMLRDSAKATLDKYNNTVRTNYDELLNEAETWLVKTFFKDFTDAYLKLRNNERIRLNKPEEREKIKDRLRLKGTPEDNLDAEVRDAIDFAIFCLDKAYLEAKKEFIDNAELHSRINNAIALDYSSHQLPPASLNCPCIPPLTPPTCPNPPDASRVIYNPNSPIILDLDGNGTVDTVSSKDGVYFDHDGNRFAEKSGWVGKGDALLVHDRNKNGQIDDGGELFGNNYILSSGLKAANGFEALKEFDSNGDGIIDKNDERWSELLLWQDKNGNGIVDAWELLTLEEAGVAGLKVDYKESSQTDENGNEHRQQGSFIREDGTIGKMNDVWFKTNLADTMFMDKVEVGDDIRLLPNLRGYGNIPDFHQAMAKDSSGQLQALMDKFVSADPLTARQTVWDIIFAWTGVTNVDPGSRGGIVDGRKLAAMEKLWGSNWISYEPYSLKPTPNPHRFDADKLNKSFAEWEANVGSYLMLSTHYNDFYAQMRHAADEIEHGNAKKAIAPLMATLRKMYSSGDAGSKAQIATLLNNIANLDDTCKKATNAISALYSDPFAKDEFDKFITSYYRDIVLGTEADETLQASSSGSILDGGAGNDILKGGSGDDVFVFGKGATAMTLSMAGTVALT